jgi:predicted DNA binding CopG/RHH family protein
VLSAECWVDTGSRAAPSSAEAGELTVSRHDSPLATRDDSSKLTRMTTPKDFRPGALDMETLKLSLPEDLVERLKAVADEKGISVQQLIAKAVENLIMREFAFKADLEDVKKRLS